MRLIGTLPSEHDATRFNDYVLTLGMRTHVEPDSNGGWQVWIEHDDHLDQAAAQLHAFRGNPTDPRYDEASLNARRLRREAAAAEEKRRRNFVDYRTRLVSPAGAHGTVVTFILIAVCILVAIATRLGMTDTPTPVGDALLFQPPGAIERLFVDAMANGTIPEVGPRHPQTMFSSILHGQVWRLVTPALLHFGIIHLVFNLSWLSTLGRAIEARRGPLFFVLFFVGSAIFSNCAEALWTVYGSRGNVLGYAQFGGLSGVVYALFGYAWLKGRLQPYEGLGVPQQTVGLMIGWLFVCMTGALGPVANAAHVGGLVIGCLIGAWPTLVRRMKARA